jgi:hypothetical protein
MVPVVVVAFTTKCHECVTTLVVQPYGLQKYETEVCQKLSWHLLVPVAQQCRLYSSSYVSAVVAAAAVAATAGQLQQHSSSTMLQAHATQHDLLSTF